ncbi:hypothetical protein TEA_023967 [Camellia sinensis var. sinensis]|uniref:Uncharacterized protein n=1 Tax=Camellia sinensis var. sinensis TaxID=542762 RepID=A0A4S4CZN0_CAMSN|nr:hypothetical protein TEA_023967 [Camellia sinensis var. sinensis]
MNKPSNLGFLRLDGCNRLQELPELSSNIRNIEANDCTSLITILSLSKYDNVEAFSFMNCFKLVENEQNNILDILNGNGNTLLIFVSPGVRCQSGSVIKVRGVQYRLSCLHIGIMTGSLELFLLLLESRINPSAASVIILLRRCKVGYLVYVKEDDEEAWSIDSSDLDDNMGVFHGDLERSVEGAGVEVASSSATTSKRRHDDLNDNHDYDAAAATGPSGGFDD